MTIPLAASIEVIDLAQPIRSGIPHSPNHPGFHHALQRRHGDQIREDGTSGASDVITLGTHTATHIDALGHVSHDGLLFGGVSALDEQRGGRFMNTGVHQIQPRVSPGILFDVASRRGQERMAPGDAITTRDLEQCIPPNRDCQDAVALVRTGWAQLWDDPAAFLSHEEGVPGPNEEACAWLAEQGFAMVGSDTTAFELIPPGRGHARLPGHRVLLVENGIPIIEMLNLEELSVRSPTNFMVVIAPLKIIGATGSPIRPIALVDR